jgi:hypothetical protein
VKRKSVDPRASAATLAVVMSGPDPKPPSRSSSLSPAQAQRDARLAKALRDNLRRRKAAPASPPKTDPDTPKAD